MKRRDCCTVIKQMLEKIPEDQTELISDLNWNYEDAGYKAPEETLQWERTMQTLMKHMLQPQHLWHFEVLSIFTTKSIEQLKEDFLHNT